MAPLTVADLEDAAAVAAMPSWKQIRRLHKAGGPRTPPPPPPGLHTCICGHLSNLSATPVALSGVARGSNPFVFIRDLSRRVTAKMRRMCSGGEGDGPVHRSAQRLQLLDSTLPKAPPLLRQRVQVPLVQPTLRTPFLTCSVNFGQLANACLSAGPAGSLRTVLCVHTVRLMAYSVLC